jgi:Tfp pilus assembly protein PilO
MNTLQWHLSQWFRRLGVTGLAGIALLTAALLLHATESATLQQTAAQHARITALRTAAAQRARPAPVPPDPLAALPPATETAGTIGELEQLARAYGLALPRGQYSVSAVAGTSLKRWQLVLPVEASYPAIHAFIAAALERLPALTLDELKLKRDRIEDTQLQAELRLSLFVETTR